MVVTRRYEIKKASGKIAFGRTMSYDDRANTLGDCITRFLELAEGNHININDSLTIIISKER